MSRQIYTFLLAALMLLASPVASHAFGLESAFNELTTNVQRPTMVSSGGRTIAGFGGFEMRISRQRAQLFSFTPARISAGCGGISAHFGGFSFINGEQIKVLIENTVKAAPGMLLHMVMKHLCDICEAVLSTMQNLNQLASKMSMDSCQMAKESIEWLDANALPTGYQLKDVGWKPCAAARSESGANADFLSVRAMCDSVKNVNNTLKEWLSGKDVQSSERKATQDSRANEFPLVGNLTWRYLSNSAPFKRPEDNPNKSNAASMSILGYPMRSLLMNMVGTTIFPTLTPPGDSTTITSGTPLCDGTAEQVQNHGCTYPPSTKATPGFLVDLLMCGYADTDEQALANVRRLASGLKLAPEWAEYPKALAAFCAGSANRENPSIKGGTSSVGEITGDPKSNKKESEVFYDCGSQAVDFAENGCTNPVPSTLYNLGPESSTDEYATFRKEPGFVYQVYLVLIKGTVNILAKRPVHDDNPQFWGVVNATPFPVYQAVNIAAAYPGIAQDLLGQMAALSAQAMVHAWLSELSRETLNTTKPKIGGAPSATVKAVGDLMSELGRVSFGQFARITTSLDVQREAITKLRELNQHIQMEVLQPDMLNSEQMGAEVANKINGGG